MAVDLTPRLPKKVEGGHGIGGSHLAWSPSDLPMLLHANIGAAKLALEKNGFALPRYSDSSMVAYVLQGILILSYDFVFLHYLSFVQNIVVVVRFGNLLTFF